MFSFLIASGFSFSLFAGASFFFSFFQVHLASLLPLRVSSLLLPLLPLSHSPQTNQDVRESAGFLQHRTTSTGARPFGSMQGSGKGIEEGKGWSD